ncbi:MAG TPA: DUF456 domain-containing protein [Longimicrobiales bacterium]
MLSALGIAVMLVALLLIPFGLPGLWIMILVLAAATYSGEVGPIVLVTLALVAAGAELVEFLLVKRFSARYGGTRLAFWGAIIGGVAGTIIGVPIPIIGSVIAGILGTFAGAAAATLWQTRHLPSAARVGWGVMLARIFAVGVKTAAGVGILAVGAAALVFA